MSTTVYVVYGYDPYEAATDVGAFLSREKAEAFAQSLRDYDATKPSTEPYSDAKFNRYQRWRKKHPGGGERQTWDVFELPLMDSPT